MTPRILILPFVVTVTVGCHVKTTPAPKKNINAALPVYSSAGAGPLPSSFFKPERPDIAKDICADSASKIETLPATRLSDAFIDNCSGCHGSTGEGHQGFPAINRPSNKDKFFNAVRNGGTSMPPFSNDLISDSDLAKDFALFNDKTNLTKIDTRIAPKPSVGLFDETSYASAMRDGLLAWRTPGERGACNACHSPDALDLATFDYPNSAVLRRAVGQGLPAKSALAIVKMINAQRWRHGIQTFCRSKSFIPLQPVGTPINGATGFAKDLGLYNGLLAKHIDLKSGPIDQASATIFINAISSLNTLNIPIAISLNAWTEDSFHGDDHKSTAEWLPEIPIEPQANTDARDTWLRLENAYIETPTDDVFWKMVDGVAILKAARFTTGGVSERLAREKYKSVLLFQHMLRTGKLQVADLTKTNNLDRFSIWETAQIVDVMGRGCSDNGTDLNPFPCWNYPESFYKKMGTDRDTLLKDVLKIRLPWLIAGWMTDPGLQLTEGGDAQIKHLHDALEKHLNTYFPNDQIYNQLPIHDLYFSATRLMKSIQNPDTRFPAGPQLDQIPAPDCWNFVGQGIGQWVEQTLPHLDQTLATTRKPAITADHKSLVVSAVTAINRAILFKIKDQIGKKRPECIAPTTQIITISDAVAKIVAWQTKDQRTDDLIAKISADILTPN